MLLLLRIIRESIAEHLDLFSKCIKNIKEPSVDQFFIFYINLTGNASPSYLMLNIFCFSAQGRGVSGLQAVELRKVKQIEDNNHGLNDKNSHYLFLLSAKKT